MGKYVYLPRSGAQDTNIKKYLLGACAASESSITYLLESEPSKAVVLLAGGSSEATISQPGSNVYPIIITRRKGFVRIALKTGYVMIRRQNMR